MFSTLGPLFKTVFRQAEQTDARLEIRREEKESEGKKKERQQSDDSTDALWEDTTSVSIEALRTFLLEFLKTRDVTTERIVVPETSQPVESKSQNPIVSPIAAQAMKAYTSMSASIAHIPPVITEPEKPMEEIEDLASLLRADEIRTIHVLIADLDNLAKQGIETLNIQMTGTFLESMVEAVRLVKAAR